MAVIGKIRERGTLLLVLVGGAMVAFILGDFFSNKRGSSASREQSIGSVYGNDIERQNYELKVNEELESRLLVPKIYGNVLKLPPSAQHRALRLIRATRVVNTAQLLWAKRY